MRGRALKTLVTGGVGSGRRSHARRLAESLHPRRFLLTTGLPDEEERAEVGGGVGWSHIAAPFEVSRHLQQDGVVLLDSLTGWLSSLLRGQADLSVEFARLGDALQGADNPVVLLTQEIGLGMLPFEEDAQRFAATAGRLSRRLSRICDRVDLCVAGIPVPIKSQPSF